ncbi:MAG: hypothetical protein SGPRY_007562 [Prymnesium sp.]
MYGQPLTSWTQLEADANPGASQIVVKACNGWQVTDPISIAPTASMYEPHPDIAEEFTVTSISQGPGYCTIGLSGTLIAKHLGSESKSPGFSVHAEVLMFRRSIRITGPVHTRDNRPFEQGHQGITTVQMSPGSMQYHYVRVDNCGRIALGQYCAHFHWANNCPDCKLIGSAFMNGCNKGVTVHGTQNSMLQDSVIYNVRGAGLYFENGQEMNNTALRNWDLNPSVLLWCTVHCDKHTLVTADNPRYCVAIGCPKRLDCRCENCVGAHWDSDFGEQAGIYLLTPNQNLIENHESSFSSEGRVKPAARYVNTGFPLKVKQLPTSAGASAGFVYDWTTCLSHNPRTGEDNAYPYVVEDHVEFNHDFGAGAYDTGDVTFKNFKSYWNIKGLYWKTYRRGQHAGPLCDGCTFLSTPELPGGDGLVEFRNTEFLSGSGIRINHHCNVNGLPTGGLCASHYLITGTRPPGFVISEAAGQTSALVTFGGQTRYLAGGSGAHVIFDTSACVPSGEWVACPDSYMLRTVKIYSPNRGTLTVTSGGVSRGVPWRNMGLPQGPAAYGATGVMPGCGGAPPTNCRNYMWPAKPPTFRVVTEGYAFVVRGGYSVHVHIPTELILSSPKADLFYVDYGHFGWEPPNIASITLTVTGTSYLSGTCTLSTDHARDWLTPYGPVAGDSGIWRSCASNGPWPTVYTAVDILESGGSISAFPKSGVTAYIKSSYSSNVDGEGGYGNKPGGSTSGSVLIPSNARQLVSKSKFDASAPPVEPIPSAEALEKDQLVVDYGYPSQQKKPQSFRKEASKVLSRALSKGRSWQNLEPMEDRSFEQSGTSMTSSSHIMNK